MFRFKMLILKGIILCFKGKNCSMFDIPKLTENCALKKGVPMVSLKRVPELQDVGLRVVPKRTAKI